MEPGVGPADFCRLQRPRVSKGLQGVAAAARMVATPRRVRHAVCVPSSLDRVGRAGAPVVSNAGWTKRRRIPCDRAGARRCKLAETRLRWGMDGNACSKRRDDCAAQAFKFRLHRRLVGYLSRAVRGATPEGAGLSIGPHKRAREAIVTRSGIEGGAIYALSAELREAVLRDGQVTLHVALRPDIGINDLIAKLSAPKGKQSLSNFLRKAAHLSPIAIGLLQETARASGLSLASMSPGDLARPDQCRPDPTHRRRADRSRDLDRGRHCVQ